MTVFSTPNILSRSVAIGFLLSLATPAYSYDLGPVKIHGFASQGFIISVHNNINAADTDNGGSFDFNEFALNGTYQFSESIVFSGQIGSRKLGEEGNNDLYIDYLQADVQFTDWFGTRLGRYKVPLGFYNQTRDIDLARPTVFLPQSIYPESFRPFVASATGGMIYGNIHNDRFGDIDYELYYGRGGEDDDSTLAQALEVVLNGRDMDMTSKNVYGASLQFSPTIDGLRLGYTVTAGEADFDYTDNISGFASRTEGSMDPISVFSAEYAINDFTFISEYMYTRQRSSLHIGPYTIYKDQLAEPEGFFLGGAYHITEKLETAVYWESFYPDKNDKNGDNKESIGQQDHQAWHKAWVLAVRYDITAWWLIKAEGRVVNGTALTSAQYNDDNDLEQRWESLSLKTTFYF